MSYLRYLLVDFENVPTTDLETFLPGTKALVFVGQQQSKLPTELVKRTQKLGESLEWITITGQGKNALDFHIAYYLGKLQAAAEPGAEFIIFSKDTGFDPLVKHITDSGSLCKRVTNTRDPALRTKAATKTPSLQRALANLSKIDKSKRPRTRATLIKHVQTALGLDPEEASKVVDNLFQSGKVAESSGRLTYHF